MPLTNKQSLMLWLVLIFGAIQFPWWGYMFFKSHEWRSDTDPVQFWMDSLLYLSYLTFTFPAIVTANFGFFASWKARNVLLCGLCVVVMIVSILLVLHTASMWHEDIYCGLGWGCV